MADELIHLSDGRRSPSPDGAGRVVVSVVSHGHGRWVVNLLEDLKRLGGGDICRVVLTLNQPHEPCPVPTEGWPFKLEVVRNQRVQGFGRNHNQALAGATEEFVWVLNPDVRLLMPGTVAGLVQAATDSALACAYATQVDLAGAVESFERSLPTPRALLRRRLLRLPEQGRDWVNAACLLMRTTTWQQLRGFDEAYFMYCEDVDLCLRLKALGGTLCKAPITIQHAAQRASGRSLQHLYWHVGSLLRLWRSPAYARAAASMAATPR